MNHDADAGSDHLPLTVVIPDTHHTKRKKDKDAPTIFDKKSLIPEGPDEIPIFLQTLREKENNRTPTNIQEFAELLKETIQVHSKRKTQRRRFRSTW